MINETTEQARSDKPERTKLSDKIKHALDESLILVTGGQILIGFNYQGVFDKGFDSLPELSKYLKLGSLGLLLIMLCLVLSPAPFHRLAEHNHDTQRFHNFIRRVVMLALVPLALALGINLYIAAEKIFDSVVAIIVGGFTVLVAVFFWYSWGLFFKSPASKEKSMEDEAKNEQDGKLADKIQQVLTETRVVLPGAQALLGFQLASTLMEGFDKLPAYLKYIHMASLGCIALSTIFLMAPGSFHRIVEQGEDSERVLKFASRMILAAMVPMALGIAGDLLVVVDKVTGSLPLSLTCAAVALVMFYGCWFGYSYYRRGKRTPQTA